VIRDHLDRKLARRMRLRICMHGHQLPSVDATRLIDLINGKQRRSQLRALNRRGDTRGGEQYAYLHRI
jgi:hypothetical protein